MALVEIPRDPSPATLRWFGALLGLFLLLLAGFVAWQGGPGWVVRGLAALALLLPAAYYGVPAWRRPLYLAWVHAVHPVGVVVSVLLLAAVWYLVVTPLGLARRLAGKDPLARRIEPGRPTYWVPRGTAPAPERYFRPW